MDFRKRLTDVAEKRDDILALGLSFIFFILCIVHIIFIALGQHIEQMWMVFGTLAIMVLLINTERSLLTLFVIVIFGTFVVDEEFLLDVAAITKGEHLSKIRESRNFEVLTVTTEKETIAKLTAKLKELLHNHQNPGQIIRSLEDYRISLEIEEDIPGFESVDKDVIASFANEEYLEESVFFEIMLNKGYTVDSISDSFEKLGAAEYLSNISGHVNEAQLTAQGISLAKALGLTPVQ